MRHKILSDKKLHIEKNFHFFISVLLLDLIFGKKTRFFHEKIFYPSNIYEFSLEIRKYFVSLQNLLHIKQIA